ncbi:hypothetical protein [Brucella sp. IR073]|uniref:hypothetical protein n=1 Tax=unclassified Brucella TaxID=2632610 RepID=UPI003B982B72
MSEELQKVLHALGSVIETQQTIIGYIAKYDARFDRIDAELVKLTRGQLRLQEEIDAIKAELADFRNRFDAIDKRFEAIENRFNAIDKRFDAIVRRLDEIENHLDQDSLEIRALRKDIFSLETKVMNAIRDGVRNASELEKLILDLDNLKERVNMIERRFGT